MLTETRGKKQEARKSAEQIYMRYSELTGNLKFAIIKETADKLFGEKRGR